MAAVRDRDGDAGSEAGLAGVGRADRRPGVVVLDDRGPLEQRGDLGHAFARHVSVLGLDEEQHRQQRAARDRVAAHQPLHLGHRR